MSITNGIIHDGSINAFVKLKGGQKSLENESFYQAFDE